MRVRADEIKEGDKLPNGETVKGSQPACAGHRYIATDEGGVYIIPDWMEVEVERPEPTLTVTVTLPVEVADFAADFWPDDLPNSRYKGDRVMGLIGRAVRAELSKVNER